MQLSDETIESLKKDIDKAMSDDTSLNALAIDNEFMCRNKATITPLVVGVATLLLGKVGGIGAQYALDKYFRDHCH
ncbi:hypothetical protein [Pseudomonas sp. NPDC089569]|uniref:hypothetical protein n=1 Tax=Pseudomonas sp. NPDC089569 TaxID=3390722 RepID=UPI003D02CB1D